MAEQWRVAAGRAFCDASGNRGATGVYSLAAAVVCGLPAGLRGVGEGGLPVGLSEWELRDEEAEAGGLRRLLGHSGRGREEIGCRVFRFLERAREAKGEVRWGVLSSADSRGGDGKGFSRLLSNEQIDGPSEGDSRRYFEVGIQQ